jgi:hypothetical protein
VVTIPFKEAYRGLAARLVAEVLLPDADAVFFLTHDELGRTARDGETGLVPIAWARPEAFAHQETYEFPDVFQGEPTRLDLDLDVAAGEAAGVVRGAPVSRGRVTGVARIVRNLDEAAALHRGEILIAPITDVGWNPISGAVRLANSLTGLWLGRPLGGRALPPSPLSGGQGRIDQNRVHARLLGELVVIEAVDREADDFHARSGGEALDGGGVP